MALNNAVTHFDSVMQLQLLGLLDIVLVESCKHTGLPDHSVWGSALFSSTLLSGIQINARFHTHSPSSSSLSDSAPTVSSGGSAAAASASAASSARFSSSTLSHWVGFAVQALPYLRRALPGVAFAVINVLCGEMLSLITVLDPAPMRSTLSALSATQHNLQRTAGAALNRRPSHSASAPAQGAPAFRMRSSAPQHGAITQDISILLEGLKRVLHYCIVGPLPGIESEFVLNEASQGVNAKTHAATASSASAAASSSSNSSGLFGYFFGRSAPAPSAQHKKENKVESAAREAAFQMLPVVVEALVGVWALPSPSNPAPTAAAVAPVPVPVSAALPASSVVAPAASASGVAAVKAASHSGPASPRRMGSTRVSRAVLLHSPPAAEPFFPALTAAAQHSFVPSATLNWLLQRRKLQRQVIDCLEPIMRRDAARLVRALLHSWEKELAAFTQLSHQQQQSAAPSANAGSERHTHSGAAEWIGGGSGGSAGAGAGAGGSANSATAPTPTCFTPTHGHIIQILNQMPAAASPEYVIGAIVPVAIAIILDAQQSGATTPSDAASKSGARSASVTTPSSQRNSVARVRSDGTISTTTPTQAAANGGASNGGSFLAPLRIDETAALHFLDSYLKQCVGAEQLPRAWPALHTLVRDALQYSEHPFTFLWLFGLIQQYIRRVCAAAASAAAAAAAAAPGSKANSAAGAGAGGSVNGADGGGRTGGGAGGAGSSSGNAADGRSDGSAGAELLTPKLKRELQEVAAQLIQTCALMAGQTLEFSWSAHYTKVLPPAVYYLAPRDEDEVSRFLFGSSSLFGGLIF
jgi:hypothetical protein